MGVETLGFSVMMFVTYKLLSKKEKCALCVGIYRQTERERWRQT